MDAAAAILQMGCGILGRLWVSDLAAAGILDWGSGQDFCRRQPSPWIFPGWEISHVWSFSALLMSEGTWHVLCCCCPASWSPLGWAHYLQTASQTTRIWADRACSQGREFLPPSCGRVGSSESVVGTPRAPEMFGGSWARYRPCHGACKAILCQKPFLGVPMYGWWR